MLTGKSERKSEHSVLCSLSLKLLREILTIFKMKRKTVKAIDTDLGVINLQVVISVLIWSIVEKIQSR